VEFGRGGGGEALELEAPAASEEAATVHAREYTELVKARGGVAGEEHTAVGPTKSARAAVEGAPSKFGQFCAKMAVVRPLLAAAAAAATDGIERVKAKRAYVLSAAMIAIEVKFAKLALLLPLAVRGARATGEEGRWLVIAEFSVPTKRPAAPPFFRSHAAPEAVSCPMAVGVATPSVLLDPESRPGLP